MKVFFHSRSKDKFDWSNQLIDVDQVPAVGEYFNIHDDEKGESITRVYCVVHTPFEGAICDAEVFGVWEREADALSKAFEEHSG